MRPAWFCAQSRVLIVAGKGGVGKTTTSAAVARMAASAGLTTLIVEVEGKSGLGAAFGRVEPLSYHPVVLRAGGGPEGAADVRARLLTPDDALLDYLRDHGMHRLSRRLLASGTLDVVATAAPGIKDILVLGKVKQLERSGEADLVVIDAPAAGHAIAFLTSASGLLDAVRVGPVAVQARDVAEMLADPSRCRVMLVTLPEETPVNEVVQTAHILEDQVGLRLAPVVVNGVYPHIAGLEVDPQQAAAELGVHLRPGEARVLGEAARFRVHRQALQAEQMARLANALALPQLQLPFLFTTDVGPAEVDLLAAAMAEGVEALAEPQPAART